MTVRYRINSGIKAESVRVITDDGEQLGVISVREAIRIAEDRGMDLVEVSPRANPPVCKVIDHGKFLYQRSKKEKENKKASSQVVLKEIKLRPNIGQHDLDTKMNKAKGFIEKGFKVKFTCFFRGREIVFVDRGQAVLVMIKESLAESTIVDADVKRIGRSLMMILAPPKKR